MESNLAMDLLRLHVQQFGILQEEEVIGGSRGCVARVSRTNACLFGTPYDNLQPAIAGAGRGSGEVLFFTLRSWKGEEGWEGEEECHHRYHSTTAE